MADRDLHALGQLLQEAREARALTLDEVERRTRIRVKYLEALESGDISLLPSTTHAKGFLRNYAQFLQLDANELVARFGEITGVGTAPVTTLTAAPGPPPVREPLHYQTANPGAGADSEGSVMLPAAPASPPAAALPPGRPVYITPGERIGPAIPRGLSDSRLSVQPGMPALMATSSPSAPRSHSLPGRLLQSNLVVAAVLLGGLAAIIWWTTTRLSRISVDSLVPTPEQSQFLEAFSGSATVPPTPTFLPTSIPQTQTGPQILDRVLLRISVEQRAWVRITVDGEIAYEGQADPGSVLQYEGQNIITVLTGNGAGLVVTYNGLDIGPLGERGEVVERFFSADGQILTPTPTPTLTPTPTNVPTPTPRATTAPGG